MNLGKINIIVGSNNSGKSSIIQSIQFAVSVAQTTTLEKAKWNVSKDRLSTSIYPTQLIYSPLRDVNALSPSGKIEESPDKAVIVKIKDENRSNNKNICT